MIKNKKIVALILSAVMTMSMGVCAFGEAVEEAPVEGEILSVEAVEDDAVEAENEEIEGEIVTEDTEAEESSQTMASDINKDDNVVIKSDDKPYLALGADLTAEQKSTVLKLMGVDESKLSDYIVVEVNNSEEHAYLDEYMDSSKIGTKSLSSVVIVKREKGSGVNVSTKNINYCTVGMYKNALATAGLQDADVIVAGPFELSGTAALIGAMKAYAEMEGTSVDEESLDAAMNEIVVTGELASSLESINAEDGEVEEFIAYLKSQVLKGGLKDEESIKKAIDEACEKYGYTLTDGEKASLTDMLIKISGLDIDVNALLDQAQSVYESFESGDGNFFTKLINMIVTFFKSLFGLE